MIGILSSRRTNQRRRRIATALTVHSRHRNCRIVVWIRLTGVATQHHVAYVAYVAVGAVGIRVRLLLQVPHIWHKRERERTVLKKLLKRVIVIWGA